MPFVSNLLTIIISGRPGGLAEGFVHDASRDDKRDADRHGNGRLRIVYGGLFFLRQGKYPAGYQVIGLFSTPIHLTRPVTTCRIPDVRIWREELNPRLLQKNILATTSRLDGT